MAWLDLFRGSRKSAATLDLFREIYGRAWATKAGRTVNLDTALQTSTVFGIARLLGNGMAQVPCKLMRAAADGRSRLPATDHPLYDLIGRKPNPWQTSFEFRQQMSWHVEICGRFIAFKNAPAGKLLELIPFEPDQVEVRRREDLSLEYVVTAPNGSKRTFPEEVIWHVRGPSWNGWSALSPLRAARDAIGLSIALEESQASLHESGVRASGTYSVEGKLTPQQHKDLSDWINAEHVGPANAGKPMILDRAAKWLQTQMTSLDAQTLESRKEQIADVCRFFGVLPIMLGHTDKVATYASAESMFLAHVVHTLSPRWTMYEQAMDAGLLTDAERKDGLYFDFVEEGMIRGSVKDTKDAILGYVNGGVLTPNEGRALLDRNPDDDPDSDKLRIPVNTVKDPSAGDVPPDESGKKALAELVELRAQLGAIIARPPQEIHNHIDAKHTIAAGALHVPVDARTTIGEGAVKLEAPVTVQTTVEPAAPVVKAYPSETEEIITRDDKGEIKSVVKRAKE